MTQSERDVPLVQQDRSNVQDAFAPTTIRSAVPEEPARLERDARILIGWLNVEMAQRLMTSQRGDVQLTPAQVDVITRARAAVEARPADVDQDGVVEPAPDEMSDYVSEFLASPAVQPYVNEGWKVGVADLSRVCAFQPNVFVDHAAARTEDATAGDLASIAPITLPLPSAGTKLNAQYDEQRQVLMISSPNPNLRVSGFGTFQSTDGSAGFGFTVAMAASFVQVAKYQGRYLLRDGYHRSVGLLRRGIERVPCLV